MKFDLRWFDFKMIYFKTYVTKFLFRYVVHPSFRQRIELYRTFLAGNFISDYFFHNSGGWIYRIGTEFYTDLPKLAWFQENCIKDDSFFLKLIHNWITIIGIEYCGGIVTVNCKCWQKYKLFKNCNLLENFILIDPFESTIEISAAK